MSAVMVIDVFKFRASDRTIRFASGLGDELYPL